MARAKGGKTPIMAQYESIKAQHTDAILFFRMGDFYEMFHDDAKLAAEELDIVLTARDKDGANPIPMAGVPHHSYKGYAARLLRKGYKVALCEQTSDPKTTKGIVDREVLQVLTPGTVLEEDLLDEGVHNYLACLAKDRDTLALAQVDVSTGEAVACVAAGSDAGARLGEELLRTRPAEVLLPRDLEADPELMRVVHELNLPPGAVNWFERSSRPTTASLRAFFGGAAPAAASVDPALGKALSMLHAFLGRTHGERFEHFAGLEVQALEKRMQLDAATVRNLELVETLIDREAEGSLLSVLDRTSTSMGSRLLRSWLLHPLNDGEALEQRYEAVERLVRSLESRREVREALKKIFDVPRCLARLAARNASPRDMGLLRASLRAFPNLYRAAEDAGLEEMAGDLLGFDDLRQLMDDALADEVPQNLADGGVIRAGYNDDLDRLRGLTTDAKDWIAAFEAREREVTGIKSLKVKFNKVFGYFLEVTKSNLSQVPTDRYVRKQTMVNAERYITDELKTKEHEILTADERSKALEADLFRDLRERVAERYRDLQRAGAAAARLDVICTLAEVAEERNYVRPTLVDDPSLCIEAGRHPVVEALAASGSFVPNDLDLDPGRGDGLVLLTGPNMAGKSTFLRQTALIQLLAQMGSFVPAARATLGLADRIFTRVGASDDLSRGESTFMVEMREAAFILNHVTPRSLVILDEVGRGTATFDGLSIAWAMVEHLAGAGGQGAKVLFATHYHELTGLQDKLPGVANLSVEVEEQGEDILFLHRVVPGPADKSYGIHVARLAGFPDEVVRRARVLLEQLESGGGKAAARSVAVPELAAPEVGLAAGATPGSAASGVGGGEGAGRAGEAAPPRKVPTKRRPDEATQLTLFGAPDPVVDELRKLDPMNLTPIQALQELARLKSMV